MTIRDLRVGDKVYMPKGHVVLQQNLGMFRFAVDGNGEQTSVLSRLPVVGYKDAYAINITDDNGKKFPPINPIL